MYFHGKWIRPGAAAVMMGFLAAAGGCGGSGEVPVPVEDHPAQFEARRSASALPWVPPERNPFGLSVHTVPYNEAEWDRIAWLGIGWARIDAPWWSIHRGPGEFVWSRLDGSVEGALARGIDVLVILEGTPPWTLGFDEVSPVAANLVPPVERWREFVREAVRRYRPGGVLATQRGWPAERGVRTWEIWNEPDLRVFWSGTARQYREVIWLPAVRAIRREDPEARIALGGLCCFEKEGDPWPTGGSTRDVLATPESRRGMDIFNLHYYPRSIDKTVFQDPWLEMDERFQEAQRFLDEIYGPAGGRPIWLTETGFSGRAFGEEAQGLGIRRIVGRVFLGPHNRAVRPRLGLYHLEKIFLFNSISADFGVLELEPLYRPTAAGLAWRRSIAEAFQFLGL